MTLRSGPPPWRPEILVMDGPIAPEAERRGAPLHPSPGAAPLVIREPVLARAIHRDVAIAGSDVITAATADLHRRALARTGNSRRAREWVAAAMRMATEAIAEAHEVDGPGVRRADGSPRPLRVAGLLGPLEGAALPDLAPDASVASAEHRTQAGLLAEHGAGLLRIERVGTVRESAAATAAATETGLETWSGVLLGPDGSRLAGGEPVEAWLEAVEPLGPAALVVAAASPEAVERAVGILAGRTGRRIGAHLVGGSDGANGGAPVLGGAGAAHEARSRAIIGAAGAAEGTRTGAADDTADAATPLARSVTRLVEAGVTLLGPGEDGGPARIAAIRAWADEAAESRRESERARRSAWRAWLAEGAARAGGGRALWLADAPPSDLLGADELPEGFVWQVAPSGDLRLLPAARYALVVGAFPSARDGTRALTDLLAPGGWLLVVADADEAARLRADDRLMSVAPTTAVLPEGIPGWIARRRP